MAETPQRLKGSLFSNTLSGAIRDCVMLSGLALADGRALIAPADPWSFVRVFSCCALAASWFSVLSALNWFEYFMAGVDKF